VAKIRKPGTSGFPVGRETADFLGNQLRDVVAQVLPPCVTSNNVFRAALLSIVVTLAVGQDAALLCSVWCHSGGGTAGACEHQTETASRGIVANDDCVVNANPLLFVREDGRRNAPAPDVTGTVAVSSFILSPPATEALSGYKPNGRLLLQLRPLVLALRI
jgi:hypothetical protein